MSCIKIACAMLFGALVLVSMRPAEAQTFAQSCTVPSTVPLGSSSNPTDPPSITTYPYASDYAATQYPIVLLTGALGSPNTGENNSQYWYQIPQTLSYYGATVCVPDLSGVDSDTGPDGRGQELINYLEGLRSELGNPSLKFNLIGHSQGGLTARVAAYTAPDLVASVTTIGTPHHGSPLTDLLVYPDSVSSLLLPLGTTVSTLTTAVLSSGLLSALYPGQTIDPVDMLGKFTSDGIAQFNTQYPSLGLGNYQQCTSGAAPGNGGWLCALPLFVGRRRRTKQRPAEPAGPSCRARYEHQRAVGSRPGKGRHHSRD
ncbi:alpha/beta fold hydrolase [Dyella jejuensis]|uniref:Alpha/beta fold hydrolase n=1 Tax=Dyella jejuensis TaxID=1432009 RepID=A0ABW8JIY7_9GAMM